MLKFLATQYNRSYVVQPLPVKEFSARFSGETEVELRWQPTMDPSESTAMPDRYMVYTRLNDGGFDHGVVVDGNSYKTNLRKDDIYSFRVVAVNEGGKSFPSETLSVCRRSDQKGEVLIVNGFTLSPRRSVLLLPKTASPVLQEAWKMVFPTWPTTILSGRCTNSGASSPGWTTMPQASATAMRTTKPLPSPATPLTTFYSRAGLRGGRIFIYFHFGRCGRKRRREPDRL